MATSKFFEKIKSAVIERQVEDVYNEGISLYFSSNITYPFACDGLLDTHTENGKMLKLIIEYKFDEDMQSKVARSKIIAQVLYYLKRFENEGLILPNVCLIGDKNECFVFHTNDILSYLDEDIDWSIAPSGASVNADLILKLANDDKLNPFIFDVDENFSFKNVADKITDLAENVQRYVRVTEHNIATIYEYFCDKVIKDKSKIAANDLVSIFMGVITDSEEYFQHPTKKNILVCKGKNININGNGFVSFFSYFNRNYTPQEKNKFAEISDRLIEDTNRRNKGEFYTPTAFADYAHRYMEDVFGADWKDKYVVWDCCCGSNNLTRDYYFKELYCSTLENAELEIGARYNQEATKFQFDFLNDEENKLPQNLINAFKENKPIIFFINPPYATAASGKNSDGKTSVSNTKTYDEMMKKNMGRGSQNLYAQFLYRIIMFKEKYNLNNIHIGLFSPTNFLATSSFKNFRKAFLNEFSFTKGMFFNASHFADVSSTWGISFSVWGCGKTENKDDFNYNIIDFIDGEVQVVKDKVIYNTDNRYTLADWVRKELKENKTKKILYPHLSSGIKVSDKDNQTLVENSFGSFCCLGNNVCKNSQGVALFSSIQTQGNASISNSIIKENFDKVCVAFAARKVISNEWELCEDEYIAPNETHEKYSEFVNDSLIYSLFSAFSQQSSLRQIDYKGKKWDIKNEFFFIPKGLIMEMANENGFDFTYNDARVSNDRYVFTKLTEIELSSEAKAVLDKATDLVIKSFKYRALFNDENPQYQIMNWDASYYQLKPLWKEYLPSEYKEFLALYKTLADKMRPMVYELGFLK